MHIMKDNKYEIIRNNTRILIVWVDCSVRENFVSCVYVFWGPTMRKAEIFSHTHTHTHTHTNEYRKFTDGNRC